MAGATGVDANPGDPRTKGSARPPSGAQDSTPTPRSRLPFLAVIPQIHHGSRRYFTIPSDWPANCDHMNAMCLRFSSSSFREPSQAYQEAFPRVGDEQEIEEGHPKEARRVHASYQP